jgi:hypothetical protein
LITIQEYTTMNMRKKLITAAAVIAITASTALTGAGQTVTDTSSITIGSGAFTVSFSASDWANLPYSLVDQYSRAGQMNLLVNDQSGDNGGWTVTLSISDFVGQNRPGVTDIPAANLLSTSSSITVVTDGSQPVTADMIPVTSETAPQLTWTALPGAGAGAYNLNMVADLLVPGRTIAQTYTATGTVQVVAGP